MADCFHRQGHALLADLVSPDALRWVNEAVARWIEGALDSGQVPSGVAISGEGGARRVIGGVEVQRHLGATAFYLMGAPALAEAIHAVCGPEAVPSQDWMVIKNPGDGRAIGWHQDMVHDRRHTVITVGLHLNDSAADALRVVPDSRHQAQRMCEFAADLSYDSDRVCVLEVPAGGALLHDVMMVHGSPPLPAGHPSRKTYYMEFRPAASLSGLPGWSEGYLDLRRELWTRAQALHRRLGPAPSGDPHALLEEPERVLVERLLAERGRVESANYCVPAAAGLAGA